jgi:serine/threonine-protein kinase
VDPLLWKRIGELFAEARVLSGESRIAFLRQKCGDDRALFEQLISLLDVDREPGLLDATPTVSMLPVTQVIAGRFKIIRYIAEGGMGTVYEAEDMTLNDRVALKTIRPDIASHPGAVERFKREIVLGKKVTHPNVCRIYDLGVDHTEAGAESFFLTMQFLDGETLASRVKRGPMPTSEALPLIEDMTDALSAAHHAEVIHRDFKSGNVMLVSGTDRIRGVVTDFGLARGVNDHRSLTHAGIVGTVDYMAPEQIRGEEITPAADIYALGVVMYEMVTGQRPFTGDSTVTIALKHLNEEAKPPRDLAPGLHPNWDEAILRCLRKPPSERFASVIEVKVALVRNDNVPRRRLQHQPSVAPRLIASLTVTLGLAVAVLAVFLRHRQNVTVVPDRSIAVLPFQESGGTPEYFSFGFTEEVMNALGQVPDLRVIGPESSFRFKSSGLSAIDIGKELKAHYVLIGSVLHASGQIQVIARLVDTRDGSQVWSKDMSRNERDVLSLRDDIARTVAREMKVSISGPPLSSQSIDAAGLNARDLYWTGRFFFHQRTDDSVLASLNYFRQAVKRDANFAEAYCGVADALFVLAERDLLPPGKALVEARQAAHRAVELNDHLPAAYVSLGQVTSVYDRDFDEAERLFRHALALDPRLAPGWQWLSYQLAKQRRFSEAVQAGEAAVAADPLSTAANINLAVVDLYAGLDDRALEQTHKLTQTDPNSLYNFIIIALIFAHKGLFSEAIRELETVPEVYQDHPVTVRVWVEVYAEAGMKEQAEGSLSRLRARASRGGVTTSFLAAAYAAMGDKERAFTWLQRACDERDAFASVANAYPAFESLRSDPRWAPLMAQLGIRPRMASDSSDPISMHVTTTRVSQELRTIYRARAVARGAVIRAPTPVLLGFPTRDGSDQPSTHRDPTAVLAPRPYPNAPPAALVLQTTYSRHRGAQDTRTPQSVIPEASEVGRPEGTRDVPYRCSFRPMPSTHIVQDQDVLPFRSLYQATCASPRQRKQESQSLW